MLATAASGPRQATYSHSIARDSPSVSAPLNVSAHIVIKAHCPHVEMYVNLPSYKIMEFLEISTR